MSHVGFFIEDQHSPCSTDTALVSEETYYLQVEAQSNVFFLFFGGGGMLVTQCKLTSGRASALLSLS